MTKSSLGPKDQPAELAFRWTGAENPAATAGYYLRFRVDGNAAQRAAGSTCIGPQPETRHSPLVIAVAIAFAAALACVAMWVKRSLKLRRA